MYYFTSMDVENVARYWLPKNFYIWFDNSTETTFEKKFYWHYWREKIFDKDLIYC